MGPWSKSKANKFCGRETEVLEHHQVLQEWTETRKVARSKGSKPATDWDPLD